ncbi:hypothetical protein IIC_02364 [Bacillus cereus VD021]|uniref:YopX protein domain-containing protein n=1 Tax=Bacillus cereus VD021 TaxID=1053224 RepID=R8HR28_BACCE|nr:YopX family protein [Bacillus cereus]EOO75217.1 hypothetical protein IIC_02364 [Bacillus cereus VD021]
MREIKCRGRDERGKWHHGYYVDGYMFDSMTGQAETVPFIVQAQLQGHERVVSETVGQFTGITDVYGNDIYEGDIVRIFVPNDSEEKEYISKVYELDGAFTVDMVGYDIYTDVYCIGWIPEDYSVEVIGSIYENPEIIKN